MILPQELAATCILLRMFVHVALSWQRSQDRHKPFDQTSYATALYTPAALNLSLPAVRWITSKSCQ
jgi:hypothetical protein